MEAAVFLGRAFKSNWGVCRGLQTRLEAGPRVPEVCCRPYLNDFNAANFCGVAQSGASPAIKYSFSVRECLIFDSYRGRIAWSTH